MLFPNWNNFTSSALTFKFFQSKNMYILSPTLKNKQTNAVETHIISEFLPFVFLCLHVVSCCCFCCPLFLFRYSNGTSHVFSLVLPVVPSEGWRCSYSVYCRPWIRSYVSRYTPFAILKAVIFILFSFISRKVLKTRP